MVKQISSSNNTQIIVTQTRVMSSTEECFCCHKDLEEVFAFAECLQCGNLVCENCYVGTLHSPNGEVCKSCRFEAPKPLRV